MRRLWFLVPFLLVPEPTPAASLRTVAICGFTPYTGTPFYSSCTTPLEFASASARYGELHTLTIARAPAPDGQSRRAHPIASFTDEILIHGPGDYVFAHVNVLNEPDGILGSPFFRFANGANSGSKFTSVSASLPIGVPEQIDAYLDGYLTPSSKGTEGTFKIVSIDLKDFFSNETTGYTYETASGASYPFSNAHRLTPEPSTILLCGAGLIVLILKTRY